jgi:hypothetical protein
MKAFFVVLTVVIAANSAAYGQQQQPGFTDRPPAKWSTVSL